MIPRNPNGLSPRQQRDCTFQEWADPIERPAPRHRYGWAPVVFAWLLAIAAAGLVVWKAVM